MSEEMKKELAKLAIIFCIFFYVWLFGSIAVKNSTCAETGCNNRCAEGSGFCSLHDPMNGFYRDRSSGSGSYRSPSNSSSGSGYKHSYSSGYSSSYDPADYDSPEDYADDAYGWDFDDWDDAYDYWEEY